MNHLWTTCIIIVKRWWYLIMFLIIFHYYTMPLWLQKPFQPLTATLWTEHGSILFKSAPFVQQALGVSSQSDRSNMKKKLKDMRKAQEKMEKQKEKKEKEVRRSGKLPVSPDSFCWASRSVLWMMQLIKFLSTLSSPLYSPGAVMFPSQCVTPTEHLQECNLSHWDTRHSSCSSPITHTNHSDWKMGNVKKPGYVTKKGS